MTREQIRQAINNKQFIMWEIAGRKYIGIPKRIKGNMIDTEWHSSSHLFFVDSQIHINKHIKTINDEEFYNWIFEHTDIEIDPYGAIEYIV